MKFFLLTVLLFPFSTFNSSPGSAEGIVSSLFLQYDTFVNDCLGQNEEILPSATTSSMNMSTVEAGFHSFAKANQLAYDEGLLLKLESELAALSQLLKEKSDQKALIKTTIQKQISQQKAGIPLTKADEENCGSKMCCLKKYDLLYQDIKLDFFLSLLEAKNLGCTTCLPIAINKLLAGNKAFYSCVGSQ